MEQIIPLSVCVNYHDYLECALRRNRKMFKEYHIVTLHTDIDTQRVCHEFDVTVHLFNDTQAGRAEFNKSGMIHMVQNALHKKHADKWMLSLDADICLPDTFQEMFEKSENSLNRNALYSLPRMDFPLYEDYMHRQNSHMYGGKNFMGFFQLYFDKTKYYEPYSHSCRSCDDTFCNLFSDKILLDDTNETYVHHLGLSNENHFGRKTPAWKPTSPINAE